MESARYPAAHAHGRTWKSSRLVFYRVVVVVLIAILALPGSVAARPVAPPNVEPGSAGQSAPPECTIPRSAPPEWTVALCEPFRDDRHGWPVGEETVAGGKVTRENGTEDSGHLGAYQLVIEAERDLFNWVGYTAQTFSDFYAAAEAMVDVGKPETSCELVFRAADQDNYYTFSVAANYFQVSVRYRGAWQELLPWTVTDKLSAGFNGFAVLARGPELTFFLNDVEVARLNNDLIAAGQVGIGATVYQGDTAEIRFDRLLVMTPPELSLPTPTASPRPLPPPPPPPSPAVTAAPAADVCGPVASPDVQTWPVLLCETFDDNARKWTEGTEDSGFHIIKKTIVPGAYQWEMTAMFYQVIFSEPLELPAPLNDFYVAVDARRVGGPQNARYGLQFRDFSDEEQNYEHRGHFFVTDEGKFQVEVEISPGSGLNTYTLVDWTPTTAVVSGQTNRLAVKGIGSRLWFYINGQQVAEVEEPRLTDGRAFPIVVLYRGEEAVFVFDNFEIRVPPAGWVAPTPSPLTPTPLSTPTPAALPLPTPTTMAPPSPAPLAGVPYHNPTWNVSFTYPVGWVTREESSEDSLSLACGPSEQALKIFDGYLDPVTGIVGPVMAVSAGNLTELLGTMPGPDVADASARILLAVLDAIGQPLKDAGLALNVVGPFQPARAADAQGLQGEATFPYGLGRIYLAAFNPRRDFGAVVVVITAEADKVEAQRIFAGTLASLRLGG